MKISPLSMTAYADIDNTILRITKQPWPASKIIQGLMARGGLSMKVGARIANPLLRGNMPLNEELLQELATWKRAVPGRRVVGFTDRIPSAIGKTKKNLGLHSLLFDEWIMGGGEKTKMAPLLQRGATILDDNPRIHKELWERGFKGYHTLVNFPGPIKVAKGRGFKTAKILRIFGKLR